MSTAVDSRSPHLFTVLHVALPLLPEPAAMAEFEFEPEQHRSEPRRLLVDAPPSAAGHGPSICPHRRILLLFLRRLLLLFFRQLLCTVHQCVFGRCLHHAGHLAGAELGDGEGVEPLVALGARKGGEP